MLSEQQLKELATKMQTSMINIVREYIQNMFLSYFYSMEKSEIILFKGGTALRILYRSPRFSEDLDFSTSVIQKNVIEDLIQETLLKLDLEGLKVSIVESKITSGGFLGIISSQAGQYKINTSIEISNRKKKVAGQLLIVENPFIGSYSVVALKREELISEKIEAMLNRKKPRDFFDLYFMLRANLLPEKAVLKKVLPIVLDTKIDFKRELSEFLPQGHQRIIKGFKKTLESEIKRYI